MKRLYPNYVIIILKKDKYITFDIDNKIFNLLNNSFNNLDKYNINYLIIDNLIIIKISKYINNRYLEFKKRVELLSAILILYQKSVD
ncbi:MAG TPA: hypothetical protein IAB38_02940 [Candidatus Onthousia excrementipullorum]|uniref:Uncharacterized protein n=1 Tax=Candidatus Onthousia excrementipullorum TaxID=2840884 RepID=A0A9D1DUB1_9FIRM|nr:hypothetical protein [Candidatus Onthousia excrementipullorum]